MEILEAKSEMRDKLVREGFKHFFPSTQEGGTGVDATFCGERMDRELSDLL